VAGGRQQWLRPFLASARLTRWWAKSQTQAVTAVAGALWALAFLVDRGTAAYVVPPLVLAVLLPLDRAPLAAGLCLAALTALAGVALDVPSANPALLVPALVTVYAAGRRVAGRRGLLVVAGFVAAALWVDELSVATGVFVAFLFGGTWLFGTLVRRRTELARTARQRLSTLEGEDLAELTGRVVAGERARLAAEAVEVLHAAVARMRADARQAARNLDPDAVGRIHTGGAAAVEELRRLLGLLRSAPEETDAPAPVERVGRRRAWLVDGLPTAAAVVLLLLDRFNGEEPHGVPALLLGLVPCLALLLRRRDPAVATAVAAVPVAAVLLLDAPMVDGLGDILVIVLLGWSVGGSTGRWPWTAFTALAALHLGSVWRDNPGNLAITAATFALPLFAGHAWAERDREAVAAHASSEVLLDHRERQIAHAVTEERLRIARELHDVASHAVGVMVLQAGAAQALQGTAPERARDALLTVDTAGAQALAELSLLRELLAAPGPAATDPGGTDLRAALVDLADRVRATGLVVDLHLAEVPARPDLAAAAYRVVQEALTNAARHAPGSHVEVRLARDDDGWVVEVTDDGAQPRATDLLGVDLSGTGHGLIGLRERVRLLGGDLAAGPRDAGGYRLLARIPDHAAAPGPADPVTSPASAGQVAP
jgi:signal transduction histidine kinase